MESREAWLKEMGAFDHPDEKEQARRRATYVVRRKSAGLTYVMGPLASSSVGAFKTWLEGEDEQIGPGL